MLFLIQILKKVDGTYTKGTSQFGTDKEAISALYVAMSSAMAKDDTQRIVCVIMDESGIVRKREVYEVPAETPIVEEV